MKEKVSGPSSRHGLTITGEDVPDNIHKAQEVIEREFPKVTFQIITDPNKILNITTNAVEVGHVLFQVKIPDEQRANFGNIMKTWQESLDEMSRH